jgi:hypothetical protein
MRKKVQKEATDATAVLERFGDGYGDWSVRKMSW